MGSRFRNSLSHQAGTDDAQMMQGRVVNINLVKWTVDVVCTFDRKRFFEIQVGGPYMHFSNGEGIYAFPEVGATCVVCVPGDSSPPFVAAFLMPHEVIDESSSEAPFGTSSHGQPPANPTSASFAGGRPRPKPGDIFMRGRDNNFVILHRGGVLSIGASELAQRIYIPLGNIITDVSEQYNHHNIGGSMTWGLQDGPAKDHIPTQFMQTFRVFADDKYADIRVAKGRIYSPVGDSDAGAAAAAAGITGGDDNPIIYEVVVAPKGFVAESGDAADASTVKNIVLKFIFDRQGNTLFKTEGNMSLSIKKKLTLSVDGGIDISSKENISIRTPNGVDIDGGEYAHVKGQLVRLGPGTSPIARLGDAVNIPMVAHPCFIQFFSPPAPGAPISCTITSGPVALMGVIATGQQTVRA